MALLAFKYHPLVIHFIFSHSGHLAKTFFAKNLAASLRKFLKCTNPGKKEISLDSWDSFK